MLSMGGYISFYNRSFIFFYNLYTFLLLNLFIRRFLFVFMKFKEIAFASMLFLSSTAFSQNKLHFSLYGKGERFLSPKLKIGYLEKNSNKINFSFFMDIYEMNSVQLTDSTYQETFGIKIPWNTRKEVFSYSFKDSCYILDDYCAVKGEPRLERDSLEGKVFDKKYKTLSDVFQDFEKGLLQDSVHFIVLGIPYSVKFNIIKQGNNLIYSCETKDIIKEDPEDFIIFPYPINVYARKHEGKIKPFKFSTRFKNILTGRNYNLEGHLEEE